MNKVMMVLLTMALALLGCPGPQVQADGGVTASDGGGGSVDGGSPADGGSMAAFDAGPFDAGPGCLEVEQLVVPGNPVAWSLAFPEDAGMPADQFFVGWTQPTVDGGPAEALLPDMTVDLSVGPLPLRVDFRENPSMSCSNCLTLLGDCGRREPFDTRCARLLTADLGAILVTTDTTTTGVTGRLRVIGGPVRFRTPGSAAGCVVSRRVDVDVRWQRGTP